MIDVTDLAWSSVSGGPRTVLLAAPRSFCAGVDRAIEIIESLLRDRGPPVYVRKQIVHNDPTRVSCLTQTTLAVDETREIVDALRGRFSALQGPGSEDICYATTNRQDALTAVAREADLVLVVGSDTSSNSNRLVELCRRQGVPAHLGMRPGTDWDSSLRRRRARAPACRPTRTASKERRCLRYPA